MHFKRHKSNVDDSQVIEESAPLKEEQNKLGPGAASNASNDIEGAEGKKSKHKNKKSKQRKQESDSEYEWDETEEEYKKRRNREIAKQAAIIGFESATGLPGIISVPRRQRKRRAAKAEGAGR